MGGPRQSQFASWRTGTHRRLYPISPKNTDLTETMSCFSSELNIIRLGVLGEPVAWLDVNEMSLNQVITEQG
jgi:hypothetical protein